MDYVNAFVDNITPGNYFLTKSMELTKKTTSGTLWYLKKFLVFYDAIFLSKSIKSPNGMAEIIEKFESYIKSLPEIQREEAEKFFFPENIDIRKKYRDYFEFAGPMEMEQYDNRFSYEALVNKYYFVYLMNIGGQSGVNAFLRDKIYNTDFTVKNLNYLISEYKNSHPEEKGNMNQIINDYHAALRNERQILFYFGLVHSRSNGAGNDREFASLTPLGELAIYANAKEFALLWEHQKIKMVSQPVTVEFPSVRKCRFANAAKFKINYSPYFTILKCLQTNNRLAPRFYDIVLSRTNNDNALEVIKNYDLLNNSLEFIKSKIVNFDVRSDVASEDFEKEIKKYMLGLRSDLPKDRNEHKFGCVKLLSNDEWIITDKEKLNSIIKIYEQIEEYKKVKYSEIFADCEKELQIKYKSTVNDENYDLNKKIKMNWDLYNIKKEKIIILSLIINDYVINKQIPLENVDYKELYEYSTRFFANVMKSINLKSKPDILDIFKEILERLNNKTLKNIEYEDEYSLQKHYINKYSTLNSTDLYTKMQEISKENIKPTLERKRDGRIVDLLNAYYLANYSDENKLIKCECCGHVTFIKNNDEPYLEYHHLIPFGIANGPDHYENLFALCPMCHRKIHAIKDCYKEELYNGIDNNNLLKKTILLRLKDLYANNILKSYQLEYAISEQMINEAEYSEILA